MRQSRIATLDPIDHAPIQISAHSAVALSSGDLWDAIVVERHVHDRLDTPEFEIPEHSVVLHLGPTIDAEHWIDGSYRRLRRESGVAALFPADAPRRMRAPRRHEVLVVTLAPELVSRAGGAGSGASVELEERHDLHDRRIDHIVRALALEAESGCPLGPLYGESLGLGLAAYLARKYGVRAPGQAAAKGGIAPKTLQRVLGYIHDNLGRPIRLSSLADIVGLSEHRFAHNFKQSTGQSPYRYVTARRVEQAKRMLRETDMTITEVALTAGFSNASRFSETFGRLTGSTPTEFRLRSK